MKDHPAYNRHTVYLFFFDQGTDAAVAGYMPLNGQFGYITGFTAARQAEYYRTIAHEIAHVSDLLSPARNAAGGYKSQSRVLGSTFNLRHTFSPENRHMLSEGTTNNLLDYNGGTALYKYQWDLIHDPEKIWFAWLEEEGEGEMITPNPLYAEKGIVLIHAECTKNCDWSSLDYPEVTISKGFKYSTLINAYQIAQSISEFNTVLNMFNDKKNTLRIIESNMAGHAKRSSINIYLRDNVKQSEYELNSNTPQKHIDVFNKWLITSPQNYSLVIEVNIYPKQLDDEFNNDKDKEGCLALTIGHEIFIHYSNIEALILWRSGNYKEAINKAISFTGPNGGDYDHRDYIQKKTDKPGINQMYSYLNSLKLKISESVYNKVKTEHDQQYLILK